MALSTVFSPAKPAEVWAVPTGTAPDTAVVGINGQSGITATGSGDFVKTETFGPYTISGVPAGSVGLAALEAAVYVDGTFEQTVTDGTTSTPQNTIVYITTATGVLTITEDGTTPSLTPAFGKVNLSQDYVRVAGILPVQIGV